MLAYWASVEMDGIHLSWVGLLPFVVFYYDFFYIFWVIVWWLM